MKEKTDKFDYIKNKNIHQKTIKQIKNKPQSEKVIYNTYNTICVYVHGCMYMCTHIHA